MAIPEATMVLASTQRARAVLEPEAVGRRFGTSAPRSLVPSVGVGHWSILPGWAATDLTESGWQPT